MNSLMLVVAVYMGVLIVVGFWVYRRNRSLEDYLLGGRSIGPAATALTMQSTNLSGYMFLGAPAFAFSSGWFAMWYALGDAIGSVISFGVLGRRMRKLSEQLGALSPIEYLEKRYESPTVRLLGSVISLVFLGAYVLAQFVAAGKAMELVLDIPFAMALTLGVVVILLYTTVGGYLAIVWTACFQAIVMLVGMFGLLLVTVAHVGGLGSLNRKLSDVDPTLVGLWGRGNEFQGQWGVVIGAVLIYGIGLMGLPHLVVRFMSMREPETARKAMAWSAVWNQFFVYSPYLLGLCAIVLLPQLADAEMAVPELATLLLPTVVAGVVLAALLSAVMSTSDSILMQAGSIMSRDVFQRFIRPNASEKQMVVVSRLLILAIGVAGYVIALIQPPAIFTLVIFAYGVLGNAFLVPYLAAVFWTRANKVGAIAAMVAGSATNIAWETQGLASFTGLHPFLAGLTASFLGMVIFNRFGAPPSQEMMALVEGLADTGPGAPRAIQKKAATGLRSEAAVINKFLQSREPGHAPGTV